MAELTNSPFCVVLSSPDKGITLDWRITDAQGRVHLKGTVPLPSFATGQGLVLKVDIGTAEDDAFNLLKDLPMDDAVVASKLGKKFLEALEGDSD